MSENINKEKFNIILKNKAIVNFVKKIRLGSYKQCTTEQQKEAEKIYTEAFNLLIENQNNPEKMDEIMDYIRLNLFKKNDTDFWLNKLGKHYREDVKGQLEFELIKKSIKGNTLLDFGCGGGYLSLQLSKHGYSVLMTDIMDYRIPDVKYLPFEKMSDPTEIPFSNNSADTSLIFFSLHHVDEFNLKKILAELKRVSSRIIVGEDVYGVPSENEEFKEVIKRDDLLKEFMEFSEEEQFSILMLSDITSNIFEQGISGMNFPFAYKTIPEWHNFFEENGFKVVKTILRGFARGKDWTGSCHGIFVLDVVKGKEVL